MEANQKMSFFNLTVLFFVAIATSHSVNADDCVYTVYIRTGSIFKAGTDSIISLTLYDQYGYSFDITNLESWGGLMESGHDYFERGNLDIFSGRGSCLKGPICAMSLSSDGSGSHHGWYCNYVEVTATGPHGKCNQRNFQVEQWLALDTAPWELTAVRNYCDYDAVAALGSRKSLLKPEQVKKSVSSA